MIFAVSGEFFTDDTLATFGGTTVATIVVGNAIATLLKRDTKIVPFIAAVGLCFALAADADTLDSVGDWVLTFVNGCLVFCTAAGVQVTALITAAGQDAGEQRAQAAKPGRRIPWLYSWTAPPEG